MLLRGPSENESIRLFEAFCTARKLGAMEAFGGYLKYRTLWPEAQANLALAYSGLGNRSQAEGIYEKMLEADPKSADALRGLAAMVIQTSDVDAVLKLPVRLIGLGERSAEVLVQRRPHTKKRASPTKLRSSIGKPSPKSRICPKRC